MCPCACKGLESRRLPYGLRDDGNRSSIWLVNGPAHLSDRWHNELDKRTAHAAWMVLVSRHFETVRRDRGD